DGAESQAHRAALRPAVDGGPCRAGSIHHSAHVPDPFLKGLLRQSYTVGHSLTALVEYYDSSEGHHPFEKMPRSRSFPGCFDMRKGSRDQNDIAGTIAEDPVGNMNFAALRIFHRRFHLASIARNLPSRNCELKNYHSPGF